MAEYYGLPSNLQKEMGGIENSMAFKPYPKELLEIQSADPSSLNLYDLYTKATLEINDYHNPVVVHEGKMKTMVVKKISNKTLGTIRKIFPNAYINGPELIFGKMSAEKFKDGLDTLFSMSGSVLFFKLKLVTFN